MPVFPGKIALTPALPSDGREEFATALSSP